MYCVLDGGSTCDFIGVGMVKIRMFDGVVYTLDGVVYAINIWKNLISLGQLDSIGFKYSIVRGIHGCLVLIKGENFDDFYPLIGNTIMYSLTLMGSWK